MHVPDEVHDEIDIPRGVLEAGAAVVDDLVRAEPHEPVRVALGCRGDDVRPGPLRELHRKMTNAARGRVDEHALARLDLADRDDAAPRGERGARHGGGLHRGEGARGAGDRDDGNREVLRITAAEPRHGNHPVDGVARLEGVGVEGRPFDRSAEVDPENRRVAPDETR